MKVEEIARCDQCKKAHKIVSRAPDKDQHVDFICRCGNKIKGTYTGGSWEFDNATSSEREPGEAVFIHEPELT